MHVPQKLGGWARQDNKSWSGGWANSAVGDGVFFEPAGVADFVDVGDEVTGGGCFFLCACSRLTAAAQAGERRREQTWPAMEARRFLQEKSDQTSRLVAAVRASAMPGRLREIFRRCFRWGSLGSSFGDVHRCTLHFVRTHDDSVRFRVEGCYDARHVSMLRIGKGWAIVSEFDDRGSCTCDITAWRTVIGGSPEEANALWGPVAGGGDAGGGVGAGVEVGGDGVGAGRRRWGVMWRARQPWPS